MRFYSCSSYRCLQNRMKRNMIKIESDKTNYSSFNPMQANPMKAVAYRRWSNKSVDSMCKTKGVEPNPKVEMNKSTSNTLEVFTQYNP